MKTNIVNLTPHPLTLKSASGEVVLPPSGTVARVTASPGPVKAVEGFPVPCHAPDTFGAVEGLPAPVEGTFYVVSALVGAAAPRSDVLTPGTGPNDNPIRNEKGHVVAVTRLKFTV